MLYLILDLVELKFLLRRYCFLQKSTILGYLYPQKVFLLLSQLIRASYDLRHQCCLIQNNFVVLLVGKRFFGDFFYHKQINQPFFLLPKVIITPFANFFFRNSIAHQFFEMRRNFLQLFLPSLHIILR